MSGVTTPRFDFADLGALTELYPLLARVRAEEPVHFAPQLNGWVTTRYADAVAALRDPALTSQRLALIVQYQLRHSDPAIAKDFERICFQQMLFRDGGAHHRLRVLGNRGFTPSVLDRARPMIEGVVNDLLDKVQARGHMDAIADFAQPLPAVAIAELFGIPASDRDLFQTWSDDVAKFFGGTHGDPATDGRACNDGALALEDYFLRLIETRRGAPGHDLVSLLIAGQAEGKLSAAEVCAQCILILIAGHVTTIDQMGNALSAFLHHPAQWERLRADPALIGSAVEEAIRYDPAAPFTHRIALRETQIGGKTVAPGDVVYVGLAAGNRDPAAFANPDTFDIARAPNEHLSFAVGPHVCLGAGLARRELAIGLAALARRMPHLRPATEPPRRRCESLVFRGFHSLPVAF